MSAEIPSWIKRSIVHDEPASSSFNHPNQNERYMAQHQPQNHYQTLPTLLPWNTPADGVNLEQSAPRASTKIPSLAELAEQKIFEELASHIRNESKLSVYAVGGSIPITSLDSCQICDSDEAYSEHCGSGDEHDATAKTSSNAALQKAEPNEMVDAAPATTIHSMKCDPVTIRWDSDAKTSCKVTLPCNDTDRPNFEQLLRDCQPASFGRGGQNVLDETYRKAGKIDESGFCTNFNPYALGIVDTAAQTLAPDFCRQTNETHGIRAELYKLNVYSAPSGHFKAHVDTPRSQHQVGSLVICLPSMHEGGNLVLRHQGRETVFDWSGDKGVDKIHWAAFYSDCEHEVTEVTSGHRVTLTYNLYTTCWANTAFIDPEQVELYRTLKRLMDEPAFCQNGVTLGYHCAHAYPHTEAEVIKALPATLKGVDKLIYECFFAMNLSVNLRPKLEFDRDGEHYDWIDSSYGPADPWRTMLEHKSGANDPKFEALMPYYTLMEVPTTDYDRRYHRGRNTRTEWRRKPGVKPQDFDILANELKPLTFTDVGMYEETKQEEIIQSWTNEFRVERVKWLNEVQHRQPALAHGAYGNMPSIDLKYSSLTITVAIPPFQQR